jgi:hypothetical protein
MAGAAVQNLVHGFDEVDTQTGWNSTGEHRVAVTLVGVDVNDGPVRHCVQYLSVNARLSDRLRLPPSAGLECG